MSALSSKAYDMSNIVSFGVNGLSIASFVDIKKALSTRLKELYGNDIDLSDASADGQWLNSTALMINNILQSLSSMYQSLDPAVAQGYFLDVLASFSNIVRKAASASICYVTITAKEDKSPLILSKDTKFIDASGNSWSIDESRASYLDMYSSTSYALYLTSANAYSVSIPLICDIVGPIAISSGSIQGFMEMTNDFAGLAVTQPESGVKGEYKETDAHLRSRRSQSASTSAVTVIEGIKGVLIANAAIADAKVISHQIAGATSAGNVIPAHTVEVLVRRHYQDFTGTLSSSVALDDLDAFIANIIYDRLTPGIPTFPLSTTLASGAYLTDEGNQYRAKEFTDITTTIKDYIQSISWSNCIPLKPVITITLHKLSNMDLANSAKLVINAIAAYMNALAIMEEPSPSALLQTIIYADPKYQGVNTFYVMPTDVLISGLTFTSTLASIIASGSSADKLTAAAASSTVHKSCYEYADYVKAVVDSATSTTYYINASTLNDATIKLSIHES